MVKICTYNVIYKHAPKKKPSYFYCSRACCWGPAPPRILPTSPSKTGDLFKIYTRSQGPKNLGPTSSIFGLLLVPSYY
jgi:hypothetical protein